jgi:hypothetical protein
MPALSSGSCPVSARRYGGVIRTLVVTLVTSVGLTPLEYEPRTLRHVGKGGSGNRGRPVQCEGSGLNVADRTKPPPARHGKACTCTSRPEYFDNISTARFSCSGSHVRTQSRRPPDPAAFPGSAHGGHRAVRQASHVLWLRRPKRIADPRADRARKHAGLRKLCLDSRVGD